MSIRYDEAKRYFDVYALCHHYGISENTVDEVTDSKTKEITQAAIPDWKFRETTNPFTGNEVATASLRMTAYGNFAQRNNSMHGEFVLTAERTGTDAASIKVHSGIVLKETRHSGDNRNHVFDNQNFTGLVFCRGNAPATKNTCIMDCAWSTTGTAPDFVQLRGIPRIGFDGEHNIFIRLQMTDQWENGVAAVDEAVFSNPATYADGDDVVFSIPWLHENHDIFVKMDLQYLSQAVTHLKGLVTPAPAESSE